MNKQFTSTIGWRIVSLSSGLASGMLQLRVLSQYLDMERFSVVNGALTILTYLPFLDLGYRTVLNRQLLMEVHPEERNRLVEFGQVLYRRLAMILLPMVLLVVGVYAQLPQSKTAGEPTAYFLVLGFTGTISMFVFAQNNLLIGLGQQQRVFQMNILNAWTSLGMTWIGLQLHYDLWAIPLGMGVAALIQGIVGLSFCRMSAPGFRLWGDIAKGEFWGLFHKFRPEALACFRSQVAIILLFSVDIILATHLGPASLAAASGGRYFTSARLFAQARVMLQAGSEAVWPLIAQHQSAGVPSEHGRSVAFLSEWLLRFNAWMVGGTMGTMLGILVPFSEWWTQHKSNSWAPGQTVVTLMACRFFITGISSPAAYYLLGSGKFRILARACERELIVGILLSLLLGRWFLGDGVAASFLLATVCASLTPLFWAWAKSAGLSPRDWYLKTVFRGLIAMTTSGATTYWLHIQLGGGWMTIPAAAIGFLSAMVIAAVWTTRKAPPKGVGFMARIPRLANI